MDKTDRAIVNVLQQGFPVCERPFAEAAALLGLGEDDLISRVKMLLDARVLTRFGPLYQAERLGGAYALAAMCVPRADFNRVADAVNVLPEVAHNYERDHEFNMWFVLATETPRGVSEAIERIERDTGCTVCAFPKEREFFVGMRLAA